MLKVFKIYTCQNILLCDSGQYFFNLIKIRCLLNLFLIVFYGITLPSTNILYRIMSGFIFSTNQSAISLPFKTCTRQELLSDWSVYSTVLHMIGRAMMKESLTNTDNLCHKWQQICSACRYHYLVLSSFMTYYQSCN